MDARQILAVQESWKLAASLAPEVSTRFYANLFDANPALKTLFKGDIHAQSSKLTAMIGTAVASLEAPDALVPVLQQLARRHKTYGVKAEDYGAVGQALLLTLEQSLGDAFTPEARQAWEQLYGEICFIMIPAQEG